MLVLIRHLVLVALLTFPDSAVTGPIRGDSKAGAFFYLANFGYIEGSKNEDTAPLMTEDVLTDAIKKFQDFAGLQATGELDPETLELMNTPRCGIKDRVGLDEEDREQSRSRKKRYVHQGSVWKVRRLTYRITKYPSTSRLKKTKVDEIIKKAFQVWSDVTPLIFERKDTGSVHIEVRFEKKAHGDGDPFDGQGGTLAHAFFPIYGGDAHFDDAEYWTYEDLKGTNMFQTAAHEFGHSLGLSHSRDSGALMAPFYRGYDPFFKLHSDDISGIQGLYGVKPVTDNNGGGDQEFGGGSGTNFPDDNEDDESCVDNQPDISDLCDDKGRFDAIVGTADGEYFVFKGSKYYKLTDDSVAAGYPKRILDGWPGLPSNIDAAVTWTGNSRTYFFKGDKYWRFDADKTPSLGYPKSIQDGFPGVPSNLDAAFVWGGNGKIYFFKGNKYWKFDPNSKNRPIPPGYPRAISNWDLPNNIDGAIQWSNKYSYFFKRGQYYRFDDRRFTIDSNADPPFPRSSSEWWFGCDRAPIRDCGDRQFETRSLQKEQATVVLTKYDEAGNESLDVSAGDDQ